MKNVSIIIPARFKSTRFPGKPLTKISGIEMIIRVCNICEKVIKKKNIYVATDDNRIARVVEKFGYNCILTKINCLTGTDRVFQASKKIKSKIIINVQGDEPVINPNDIKKIIKAKINFPRHVICGFNEIPYSGSENINIPKVVFNSNYDMVYMSRALILKNKNLKIKNKILVKGGIAIKGLENFTRITTGPKNEMNKIINILKYFF